MKESNCHERKKTSKNEQEKTKTSKKQASLGDKDEINTQPSTLSLGGRHEPQGLGKGEERGKWAQ